MISSSSFSFLMAGALSNRQAKGEKTAGDLPGLKALLLVGFLSWWELRICCNLHQSSGFGLSS
jgi:hypothetical protein